MGVAAIALAEQADLVANLNLRDNMSAGLRRAGRNLDGLDRKVSGWGKTSRAVAGHVGRGFRTAGQNMERGLFLGGAAIVGAGAQVVKWAIEDEQAFAGVRKTMDLTEPEFEAIHDQLKGLASAMPISIEDLYGIAEAAGALGIRKEDITGFTETVALIGTTTNVSAEQAATALGHMSSLFGLTDDQFSRVAATLVDLGNKGASTESEIVELAERMAGAASIAGLTTEQTLGFAAAIANVGINAEAGGSAFSRIFGKVGLMVAENSILVEDWAKTAGLSVKQFRKSWDKDAAGTFTRILRNLGKMDKAGQTVALSMMGITGVRDRDLILRLVKSEKSIGNVTSALDVSSAAWDANTAHLTEAEKRFATTGSKIAIFQNNLRLAGTTIGDALLPPLTELLTELTQWISGHGAEVKQFGADMATALRNVIGWAKGLDWEAIGGGLRTAASAGKALIDAFLGAPDWLRTAVITGWGLNKLTGGAVVDILGDLTKGVFNQMFARGSSPMNPMWVTQAGGFGGGAALFAGGQAGAAAGTSGDVAGTMAGGFARVGGSLGNIMGALLIGGPIAGAVMLAVETFNTGLETLRVVDQAQADLQAKADAAATQTGTEALGNLQRLNEKLGSLQGFDRIIADTFGGAQQAEALANLSHAITSDQSLSRVQIVQAIGVLKEAQVQATARGNQTVANQIGADIATLQGRISTQEATTRAVLGGALGRTTAAIDRNTVATRPRTVPITIRTSLNVSAREIASEVQRVVVGNRFVAS